MGFLTHERTSHNSICTKTICSVRSIRSRISCRQKYLPFSTAQLIFAKAGDEIALLDACHKIEAYFGFPKPNELVKTAEVPGGMYSNMVAQLRDLKSEDLA